MGRVVPKTPIESKCLVCGAPFIRLSRVHEYCSHACRLKDRQPEYFRRKREKYAADDKYRAQLVENARAYRERHPDRVKESNNKYRRIAEHKVHAAAKSREWHAANKDHANSRRIMRKQKQRVRRPWSVMFLGARKRAADSGIPFDLTDEWGESRWTGKCELTGIPFQIIRGMGTKIFAPSLDRIVPSLGYVQSNCRFILFCVNTFKHNGTDAEMYMVAEALMKAKALRDAAHELGQIAAAE